MADDPAQLIADALAGGLGGAGDARLADLVEGDPAARRELALHVCWDRWLRAAAGAPTDVDAVMRALPAPGAPARRPRGRRPRARRTMRTGWLFAAAAVLAAAGAIARPWRHAQDAAPVATHAHAPAPVAIALAPAEDGTADESVPGGLPGDEPELAVRARAPQRMACLRFRLPAGRIASATLVLRRVRGAGPVDAFANAGAWDEATLRWWHVPGRGTPLGRLVADRRGGERVDVTAACVDGVCDVGLWGADAADGAFASREAAADPPRLEIVPIANPETPR